MLDAVHLHPVPGRRGVGHVLTSILQPGLHHRDLIERVKQGGSDEEILEWCFEKGRRLNEGDLFVWNGFASKLGWRDRVTPMLEQRKKEFGIADRADIQCIPDLIDFDEERIK